MKHSTEYSEVIQQNERKEEHFTLKMLVDKKKAFFFSFLKKFFLPTEETIILFSCFLIGTQWLRPFPLGILSFVLAKV